MCSFDARSEDHGYSLLKRDGKLGPAKLLDALRRAYVRMDWDNPEKVECSPILHRIPFLFWCAAMAKKEPGKLIQRLGSILLGPSDTTRTLEALPDSQQDRECAIVQKFIGAMTHFEHRALSPPTPGEEPADCLTQEGDQKVGIQVTDVVKFDHAHMRGTQNKYSRRIRELLSDCFSEFNGLSITLHYRAQTPPYPPINSKEGVRLAQLVTEKLRASIPELKKCGIGQQAAYRWLGGSNDYHAVAFIQRLTAFDSGRTALLDFSGNFPHLDAHLVLTRAIEKKLAKNYPPFPNGRFWLLAYGDEPFLIENDAVADAKSLLQSRRHPFDEVWAFFPYAAQELGFPRKVWP
jgi:hypothetical protein